MNEINLKLKDQNINIYKESISDVNIQDSINIIEKLSKESDNFLQKLLECNPHLLQQNLKNEDLNL